MFLWLQGPSLNLWREPTQVSYGWLSVRDSLFVVFINIIIYKPLTKYFILIQEDASLVQDI